MDDNETNQDYRRGKDVRNEVLGRHGLESALWADGPRRFVGDFHELTVTTAFGKVWGRDGLSRRDRRLLTLGALVVGGYEKELQLHLRAALDDGITVEEVREIFIHMSAYVGFPKALAAFNHGWPVIEEYWAEHPPE